ncbi:amidohydrolase family protein [Alloacidobacterium dinghuense]|uniref:Amidohydrolase family protein n=1 Tax=Alloacidobacterium dinghuense TaxID=2763107 RepID=A0A7G8BC73_9BACT|nr:amidohydrolase family protein [Alloacidobacterium dinghuense]QNI30143.1 amidohydrolase family protein [Alloacidobacterium dinghuense]
MKWQLAWTFLLIYAAAAVCGCRATLPAQGTSSSAIEAPVTGPFAVQELQQFTALDPIDTHTHVYQNAPELIALLERLNLHILDIVVARDPDQKSLDVERRQVSDFVNNSHGHATMCTTFDPFLYREPSFKKTAIAEIDGDFNHGAAAVKIWKNIGEQVKDPKGNYLMPDDPVFEPIYKEISDRDKTLIAHVADPNTIWEPPTPKAADYEYYMHHPEWYMYKKANAPSKAAILVARDHVLEMNPKLRVVGAHLGSMEADFKQLADHLDRYPNFAVDIAARMPYVVMLPRADAIAFIEKYQDRLIYATDHSLAAEAKAQDAVKQWESSYAFDWRFLATSDLLQYRDHQVQGLALPPAVLHKLYHDNALHWIPGVITAQR